MALLDGKQLRDQSTSLDKLQGYSGQVTFTASATMSFQDGGVLRRATADILIDTDVVNKEYVDSVAAGLDPKESVKVIATASITLSGTQSIDGYVVGVGDRVLVNGQVGATANGIYDVSAGAWSRSSDSDGTPANEVSLGNFVFVEEGSIYGGSGWVLSISDSGDSVVTPDVETQIWTQFSAAGYYTAGTGLTLTGSEFSITNTTVGAGSYGGADQAVSFTVNAQGQLTAASTQSISITSDQVSDFNTAVSTEVFDSGNFVDGTTIDFTVTAGSSVTAEVTDSSLVTGKLNTGTNGGATAGYILSTDGTNFAWILNDVGDITDVIAATGITGGGSSGSIELQVEGSNGITSTDSGVKLGGTLVENTTLNAATFDFTIGDAGIILMTASTFDVEADGFISLDAGTGSVQVLADDNVTISASNSVDLASTGGVFINNVEIDPTSALTGQALIYDGTKFAPGTMSGDIEGLTAGAGLSGGGSTGFLQLDVELTSNGGLTFSGAGDSGTLEVDYTSVASNLQGNGLTANGGVLDVNVGTGLQITSDVVEADFTSLASNLQGNGLTANGGVLDVNVNADSLEIVGDVVRLKDTVTGNRTFANNLTIQGDTQIDGNLTVSGTATYVNTENLYVEDNIITLNATYSGSPLLDSGIEVNRGTGTYSKLIWDETQDYWVAGLSGSESIIIQEAGTGLTKTNNELSVDFTSLSNNLGGAGLTANGGVLDVGAGTGIIVNADDVAVDFVSITGDGLTQSGGVISVNYTSVATNLDGAGLTANGGVLDVRAQNGLNVNGTSDAVELGGTLTKATIIDGGQTLTLGGNGGSSLNLLDVRSKDILLQATEPTGTGNRSITIHSGYTYSLEFGQDSIGGGTITDGSGNGYGLVYTADYTGTFVSYSLVTKGYVDAAVAASTTGVSQVNGGDGLVNVGGNTGSVTLAVGAGAGITVSTDAVAIDLASNSGLNTTSGLSIDSSAAGDGLDFTSGVFSVNTGDGITTSGDNVVVDLAANSGLTFSTGQLTIDSTIAGTGLSYSNGVLSVVAGSAQPVYQSATSTTQPLPLTNGYDTGITISSTPNDYSRVNVYVNGQLQRLGDGVTTTDCYFGTQSGTAVNITDIESGYTLFWNGTNAGFRIESSDSIDIIYEA